MLDGRAAKMSKSIGNVTAPQEVFETMGADILRLLGWRFGLPARICASGRKF